MLPKRNMQFLLFSYANRRTSVQHKKHVTAAGTFTTKRKGRAISTARTVE
jgi:hypothetical protein